MNTQLEGKDISLWIATTEKTHYPELKNDTTVYDVAVVGGGITGVVLAYELQDQGLRTVLVEKQRIVEWTTGSTTAKLTSQHYMVYDYLIKRHGESVARAYAKANEDGINDVESLSHKLGIECDFERKNAYVFTAQSNKVRAIQAEVEAAQNVGLPASFETTLDIPYPVKAAIKFSKQAQFHPRKYLLGLAERFVAAGGVLYEHTKAVDILVREPNTLTTNHGDIQAKFIIQASGEPFWDKDILKGRMWTKMSYALAAKLTRPADYPTNMYITTDEPLRTIRSSPSEDGHVLIFGGESHEWSKIDENPDSIYEKLIVDLHKHFQVDKVLFRWLAGDYMPYDRLPYIGPHPHHPNIYVVTGYRAWGLAWAMSAGRAVVDEILGKPPAWAQPFRLDRLKTPLRPEDKTTALEAWS